MPRVSLLGLLAKIKGNAQGIQIWIIITETCISIFSFFDFSTLWLMLQNISDTQKDILTLKNKRANYFANKMSLFGNSREL